MGAVYTGWKHWPGYGARDLSQFVFQGVNTSFALYNNSGHLVAGPVNSPGLLWRSQSPGHFGLRSVRPPFMSDPRAFAIPTPDILGCHAPDRECGGAIGPKCKFLSQYWIIISIQRAGPNASCTASTRRLRTKELKLRRWLQQQNTSPSLATATPGWHGLWYAETQFANKHAMEQCKPVWVWCRDGWDPR